MSNYEAVIGLEIHIQLNTKSKMFCGCSTAYEGKEPNTFCCPVCLGLPGALPAANREAVKKTVMMGLALKCRINNLSYFSRKNYFYPDLPKGYQISQFDHPLCENGHLVISTEAGEKKIRIRRAHLEEDTGKSLHEIDEQTGEEYSLLDFNKSGMPLLEVVSEPDFHSKEEALAYSQKIQQMVRYIGISGGNMEKGQLRCELNISLRKEGETKLPDYRIEVKNLNSFRSLGFAIDYEIERQAKALKANERLVQETRGWDEQKGITKSQRKKEEAHDYRYFPEPDIPPLRFDEIWINKIRKQLPELPDEKKQRFAVQYNLLQYDLDFLTSDKESADFYEDVVKCLEIKDKNDYKVVANWMEGVVLKLLNKNGIGIDGIKLTPAQIAYLIRQVRDGIITQASAQVVLEEAFVTGKNPELIIREKNLVKVTDINLINSIAEVVIQENPQAVSDYKKGKTGVMGFLIGKAMEKGQGKTDHQQTRKIIEEKLNDNQ